MVTYSETRGTWKLHTEGTLGQPSWELNPGFLIYSRELVLFFFSGNLSVLRPFVLYLYGLCHTISILFILKNRLETNWAVVESLPPHGGRG